MNRLKIKYDTQKLLQAVIGKVMKINKIGINGVEGNLMELTRTVDPNTISKVNSVLEDYGIELTPYTGKHNLALEIKDFLVATIDSDGIRKKKLSALLENQFEYSYVYMAQTFSKTYHMSIEKFYIIVKIERAKELLLSGVKLADIIEILDYSSVQHLSKQFKDLTGLTITEFMKMAELRLT